MIVSQPDKPSGREKKIEYTPIKQFSLENNIEVLQPIRLKNNEDFFSELRNRDLDFIVVVAY
jgi:methionyl-tRNA formyltransferase